MLRRLQLCVLIAVVIACESPAERQGKDAMAQVKKDLLEEKVQADAERLRRRYERDQVLLEGLPQPVIDAVLRRYGTPCDCEEGEE